MSHLTIHDLRRTDAMDIEDRLKELEKHDLAANWQKHRMFCLELAIKLGASTVEQAIDFAERFGIYILKGVEK